MITKIPVNTVVYSNLIIIANENFLHNINTQQTTKESRLSGMNNILRRQKKIQIAKKPVQTGKVHPSRHKK
jgi:hypothetical protein